MSFLRPVKATLSQLSEPPDAEDGSKGHNSLPAAPKVRGTDARASSGRGVQKYLLQRGFTRPNLISKINIVVSLLLVCLLVIWLQTHHVYRPSPETLTAWAHGTPHLSVTGQARTHKAPQAQAEDEQWLHGPQPPHVKARSMREFRHLQFLNDDYRKWATANLLPISYDVEHGLFSFRWNKIPDPIPEGQNEIILMTQTSVSRLQSFRSMATEWGGPVSLSVFIPYQMGTPDATACRTRVRDFMRTHSKALHAPPLIVSALYANAPVDAASCVIPQPRPAPPGKENKKEAAEFEARGRTAGAVTRRLSSVEPISDKPFKALYDAMYPVNALRNLAWAQVPKVGAFVFLLDVDFVPTPTLYTVLKAGKWAGKLRSMRANFETSRAREALVVPAFERTAERYRGDCRHEHDCEYLQGNEAPRSVERLRKMHADKSVQIFHAARFEAGHSCYSGLHWLFDQKADDLVSFEYKHPCEPYAIGLSEAMPRYDERFRGRGMNKVEQLTHMGLWGFSWHVLPEHFVLHLPHGSEGMSPEGGWDRIVVPLVLMKQKIREVEKEPEFRRHIDQDVPSAT